jgi:acyl carrier protein
MGTEKKFELKLTVEEVAELKDVGEMIDMVIKKLC